jgi:hypothetical protein
MSSLGNPLRNALAGLLVVAGCGTAVVIPDRSDAAVCGETVDMTSCGSVTILAQQDLRRMILFPLRMRSRTSAR